jgi:glucose uptake protein GlcU
MYEKNHGGTDSMLDYIFSHFCGTFAMSTIIMLGYSASQKNHPILNPQLVLPAFTSGVIWAIAQVSQLVKSGKKCCA